MANQHVLSSIFSIALLFLAGGHADATSWRINNNANRKAHFTDINAAMSSSEVQAGDTLYLDPGCTLTTSQTVSKQVAIIGTGFFLPDGTHQVATISGVLYLSAANAKIEGVTMTGEVHIRAQYVTIERCRATSSIKLSTNVNAQYATIRQCYLTYNISGYGNTSAYSAYWTIENNIILRTNYYHVIERLNNPIIRNNYILYNYSNNSYYPIAEIQGGIITNNIIFNKNTNNNVWGNVTDAVITHNVTSSAEKTDYPDNIYLADSDESLVFKMEGTNDQKYQLKDDSPAKGYATDGGDCGPYGGTHPYIPSGYPLGMPRFVSNSAGTRATDNKVCFSNQLSIQEK